MMQYKEAKKKNNMFYIIVAVCIVLVAVVSYITVTNDKSAAKTKKQNDAIKKENSSYNSNEDLIGKKTTEPTENTVTDEPYEVTETEENAEQPAEEKQSFVLPIKGNIIKNFSNKTLQYSKTYGDMRLHTGIDISCGDNSQIVSVSNGTVTDISDTSEFAKTVTIDHGNGLTVKYCGLGTTCVKAGESVGTGVLIGTVKGVPSECEDEMHVHIEAYINGEAVSPLEAFGF